MPTFPAFTGPETAASRVLSQPKVSRGYAASSDEAQRRKTRLKEVSPQARSAAGFQIAVAACPLRLRAKGSDGPGATPAPYSYRPTAVTGFAWATRNTSARAFSKACLQTHRHRRNLSRTGPPATGSFPRCRQIGVARSGEEGAAGRGGEQPAAKVSEDTLKPGARNWRILVIRHTADASARQPLVRTKSEAHNIMWTCRHRVRAWRIAPTPAERSG